MSNHNRFMEAYRILETAAVGVCAVRSREPFRALEAIREYARLEGPRPFKFWTMTGGWATPNPQRPDDPPVLDGVVQVNPALFAVNGVGAAQAPPASQPARLNTSSVPVPRGFDPEGIYVMMWPHFALAAQPPFIQCLAEYAVEFAQGNKRLVLVVPAEFTMPRELEDMIPMLDYDAPSAAELEDSYRVVVNSIETRPDYSDADRARIVQAGIGMTVQEFESAFSRAIVEHMQHLPDNLTADMVIAIIMSIKTEVVKRSEVLEIMPTGRMSEIGGLANLKTYIRKRRHAFSEKAQAAGVDKPKGIALVGPPGTGKSLTSKAIAHELGLPLIRFDISRVFAGLVGASETKTRMALKMIRSLAPCVVLVDEIDKALGGSHRGGGDSGVAQRVLGAILTEMQESPAPVFWVMSMNRTEGMPPELLRKGRTDEVFSVTLPNEDERLEILRIHLAKRKQDPETIGDLALAAERSAGYVPSEIEASVKEAITEAFHAWMEAGEPAAGFTVTGAQIVAQLADMKPLSEAFREDFQAMQTWAINNARPASAQPFTVDAEAATGTAPVRERTRSIGGRNRQQPATSASLDG